MKIKIDKFLFDTDRFITKIHSGEIYKTKYTSSEVIDNDGFLTISSKWSYKLNKDFIVDNLAKLKEQNIVKII